MLTLLGPTYFYNVKVRGGVSQTPPYLIIAGVSWGMGLEISNFLTFPLTSSTICWWRIFFDKLQGLATIWCQSRQVSNFDYMKNRKVIPMPNFEQQIIWSDVKFEFRMISAFIWYTYCWYVTKNDQVLIFNYRCLHVVHFVYVVKVIIGFNDITNLL